MIRAVLFDLWGTLIVDDPASSAARGVLRIDQTHAALTEMGFPDERADIQAGFLAAAAAHEAIHDNELDLSTRGRTVSYIEAVDAALPGRLDEPAWSRLDDAILAPARTHGPAIMADARETLEEVRALGLSCGLISNTGITQGFVLRDVLAGFGLLKYLDPAVFSDEVELCKPSPAIFAHALAAMDLTPAEVVFVGDQPVLDVFGARRAGLWCVQIGDLEADGMVPHARIATLPELVPALRSLKLIGAG
jgi:putative hydrolase of the HAD superfamily